MTTIPYETHVKIRNAVAAGLMGLHMSLRKTRLFRGWRSLSALDTDPVIWYFKDTKVDLMYARQTGFILLDHVRRIRSPGVPTLTAALKARAHTLKEAEEHEAQSSSEAREAADLQGAQAN